VIPELLNGPVHTAGLHQDRHAGDLSIVRLVHQVDDHVERLAMNVFLAGPVKVELGEPVALAADDEDAPGPFGVVVIDPDRLAVVDQVLQWGDRLIESKRREVRCLRSLNVDWRLLPAAAGGVLRIERAPTIGAALTVVRPWCSPLRRERPDGCKDDYSGQAPPSRHRTPPGRTTVQERALTLRHPSKRCFLTLHHTGSTKARVV
jgi:hypothetical protein